MKFYIVDPPLIRWKAYAFAYLPSRRPFTPYAIKLIWGAEKTARAKVIAVFSLLVEFPYPSGYFYIEICALKNAPGQKPNA